MIIICDSSSVIAYDWTYFSLTFLTDCSQTLLWANADGYSISSSPDKVGILSAPLASFLVVTVIMIL